MLLNILRRRVFHISLPFRVKKCELCHFHDIFIRQSYRILMRCIMIFGIDRERYFSFYMIKSFHVIIAHRYFYV